MPSPPMDEAIYRQLAAALEQVRTARPDLPTYSGGRTASVLTVALQALAAQVSPKTPITTWRSRWNRMQAQRPDLVPVFMRRAPAPSPAPAAGLPALDIPTAAPPVLDVPEAPAKPEPTLEDNVALDRAKATANKAGSELRQARAQIAKLEDQLAEYEAVFRTSTKPAEWTLAPQLGQGSEHTPYLFTSDFQIGETIDPEETEHAHGYDVETFRRRYRRLIGSAIDLSLNHAGGAWTFPGIIYARGGDTISGGIHDELAETDEVTPIEAVEIAFEEEAAGIVTWSRPSGGLRSRTPAAATTTATPTSRARRRPRATATTGWSASCCGASSWPIPG